MYVSTLLMCTVALLFSALAVPTHAAYGNAWGLARRSGGNVAEAAPRPVAAFVAGFSQTQPLMLRAGAKATCPMVLTPSSAIGEFSLSILIYAFFGLFPSTCVEANAW